MANASRIILTGFIGALLSCADCSDDRDAARPPWVRENAGRWTARGRVVTPAGEPIPGASVKLVYQGNPHAPEAVAYETVTDAAGAFAIETVDGIWFPVVVSHEGVTRTYDPVWSGGLHDTLDAPPDPMTIRLAPTSPIDVSAQCAMGLPPERGGSFHRVQVTFHWLPEDDLVVSLHLAAETGGTRGSGSRLRPGREEYLPTLPEGARRFAGRDALPAGRFLATLLSPCGIAAREIVVADGETTTVHFELPAPDHSELVVAIAPDRPEIVRRVGAFRGPVLVNDWETVSRGHPLRLTHLAPGAYDLRETACRDPIEVPPASVTRVTIAPGRCEVRSTPR